MKFRVEYYKAHKFQGEIMGWSLVKRDEYSWLSALDTACRAALNHRGPIRIWFQGRVIWQTTDK